MIKPIWLKVIFLACSVFGFLNPLSQAISQEGGWKIAKKGNADVGLVDVYGYSQNSSEVIGSVELACVDNDHLEYRFLGLNKSKLGLSNGLSVGIEGKISESITFSVSSDGQLTAKDSVSLSKFILNTLNELEKGYNEEDYIISVDGESGYLGVTFSILNFADTRSHLKKTCSSDAGVKSAKSDKITSESDKILSLLNPNYCKKYLESTPNPGNKILYPLDRDKIIAASTCSASGGIASLSLHALKGSESNQKLYHENFEIWKKKAFNYYSEEDKPTNPDALISVIMNIYKNNLNVRSGLIYAACVIEMCNQSGL